MASLNSFKILVACSDVVIVIVLKVVCKVELFSNKCVPLCLCVYICRLCSRYLGVEIYKTCCFKSCVRFCLGYYNFFNLTVNIYRSVNKACINSNVNGNFIGNSGKFKTYGNDKVAFSEYLTGLRREILADTLKKLGE